jgi:L-fuculose-phosphate aldolase
MWEKERKIVLDASRQLVKTGLVIGTQGNISLRFSGSKGQELVAITPSNFNYELMSVDDIVILDLEGKQKEGKRKPSIEAGLHLGIYLDRKKVNAIVHSHSIYASVLAVAHKNIPPILDDQVYYLGGEIKVAKHALPGSRRLVKNVVSALDFKNAVILANHGALATGDDMEKALVNAQLLERIAKIYVCSQAIGVVNNISQESIGSG